ncbi:MAG: J domain-containing protein [Spirochaetes bacterium]|nr:J domain-containing protein [Spirochaetota bacterium]
MESDFAFKDFYEILHVAPNASIEEIRSAFRSLARKTHPDATKDVRNYENFILIREAYDVLSNKAKRAQYDEIRRQYYATAAKVPGNDAQTLAEDFDIAANDAYKDEWEYFKLYPDDYLHLFESSWRLFFATLLAILIGMLAPFLVLITITIGFFIASVLLGIIVGATITTSLSSVVGVIFAIMVFRKLRQKAAVWKTEGVRFFGKIAVFPLRGIPKKYGKHVLYMNYAAIFALLCIFGYYVSGWIVEKWSEGIQSQKFTGLWMVIFSFSIVIVVVLSLIFLYEIVTESLIRYPSVRYMRIRMRRRKEINYFSQKQIGENEMQKGNR